MSGYSPVKLQRYQDLIERYISGEINALYKAAGTCATITELEENLPYLRITSMLNGKYIILGEDMAPVVNDYACGNCWFVNDARTAESVNEEIDFLGDTDLDNTVVLGPDFKGIASMIEEGSENPDDFIRMTSYEPNELHYECRLSSPRAVMFSEIYYPDGWKAWVGPVGEVGETIGNRFEATSSAVETEIFRGDWMLRGMILPAGEHEIVMRFEPQSYVVGTIRKQPRTVRLADQMISSILHISCQCLPCDIPKWNDPFFMDIRTDHILHLKIQIRDF